LLTQSWSLPLYFLAQRLRFEISLIKWFVHSVSEYQFKSNGVRGVVRKVEGGGGSHW
jgi:hypothetical protein